MKIMFVLEKNCLPDMTKSVLCVIDFSDSSKKALQWAVCKACTMNTHLTILHPFRLIPLKNGESVLSMKQKIEDDALRNFQNLEKDFLIGKGITYDFKSEVGFVADRVGDHARNHPINCMVIDKNMSLVNKESFEALVENLHVPMVIVP